MYTSYYLRYVRRKQIATVVLQLQLFTYCCLVLPIICSALELRLGNATGGARVLIWTCRGLRAAACCDMSWISALCECTMRLNNVEKDWKHVLTQKFVSLNTYCDITCRTFQLPHITISSFQSHWWQPTTGSLQSHKRLKECNNLQSDKKVVQFTS